MGQLAQNNVPNFRKNKSSDILTNALLGRCSIPVLVGTSQEIAAPTGFFIHSRKEVPKMKKDQHPLYYRWKSIKVRCDYPGHRSYHNYGGRGITVCQGFRDFNQFATMMGNAPSSKSQIDRVDNDGNYSCGKCDQCLANRWTFNLRWATPKENASNRRKRIDGIAYRNGEPFDVTHLAKILGLKTTQVGRVLKRCGSENHLTDEGMIKLAKIVRCNGSLLKA